MKKQTLHFRVHPNILNIIRQGYWYEDRREWAIKCLRSLGGNMTLDMAHDLLDGKNGLTTDDGGETLTTTDKPDIEFQKELKQHKKFLEEQKKQKEEDAKRPFCNNSDRLEMNLHCKYFSKDDGKCMYSKMAGYTSPITMGHPGGECYLEKFGGQRDNKVEAISKLMNLETENTSTGAKIAEKQGNKCLEENCKFSTSKVCSFGMRNNWGCYLGSDVKEKFNTFKATSMSVGRQGMDGINFVKSEAQKMFNFVYKGHNYTIKDSARNQGQCPHCDYEAPNNFWKPDNKAFIGHKIFGKKLNILGKQEKAYAACFECPKCFKKFFYHTNYKRL